MKTKTKKGKLDFYDALLHSCKVDHENAVSELREFGIADKDLDSLDKLSQSGIMSIFKRKPEPIEFLYIYLVWKSVNQTEVE